MASTSEYEEVQSRAFYHINFPIEGQDFQMTDGIENPQLALRILRDIRTKGYHPQISRTISYGRTKGGFRTREPEHEDLTIDQLEEIVKGNDSLPTLRVPITSPNPRGADIGD